MYGSGTHTASKYFGFDEADAITCGTGSDQAFGGTGNDVVYENNGNGSIFGGNDDDRIYGEAGNDYLFGGFGNDKLYGGDGDDILIGGDKFNDASSGLAETFDGGAGLDVLQLNRMMSHFNEMFSVNGIGGGSFMTGDGTIVTGIENLQIYTGSGDDSGTFLNPMNFLDRSGTVGHDHDNFFSAGAGNDSVVIDYSGAASALIVSENNSDFFRWWVYQSLNGAPTNYTFVEQVEHIEFTAGSGNDIISGKYAESVVFRGNGGTDDLTGSSGDDKLYGGSQRDFVKGGLGMDIIYGGLGNDVLRGGKNSDVFVFDTALGAGNLDKIADFSAVDDTIYLDQTIFAGLAKGNIGAASFTANTGGFAVGSDPIVVLNTTNGKLIYYSHGTGPSGGVTFAALTKVEVLTATDFVVF